MNDSQRAVSGGTEYEVPKLNRGVISEYQSYEVKDTELEILREGKDGGIYLNIALSCVSISISLIASLFLSSPQDDIIEAYLNSAAVGFAVIGAIFFFLMKKTRTKVEQVYLEILSRKKLDTPPSKEVTTKVEDKP